MATFRLRTSDIHGQVIDKEWQQFLEKEHGVHSNVGDYFYIDIQGASRVMQKDCFERLFSPVEEAIPAIPASSTSWMERLFAKSP